MLKSIEVQGRTEDEAIELALEQLGLSRDDVSVEILETAKKGLLGIKNTPAIVKVEYESDDDGEDEKDTKADKEPEKVKSKKELKNAKTASTTSAYEPVRIDSEQSKRVQTFLTGLFERMELDVTLDVSEKDGSLGVNLSTSDPGVLIGRRGETLDALQHLTNYVMNRDSFNRARILLDSENYRQRRSEALISLATRTASRVVKYRRNMTLDPMNAYDRHIIHSALQDYANISTFSVGNDSNRRVVIAYGQGKTSSSGTETPQYKEWS
ncbi:MAG: protein jag [Oscillospiraceae bacterium]|nr:protein jag [Oscillospiraceae bacterium]